MDFLTSVRDDFYQTIYRGNAKREGLFSRATPRPLNPIFDAIRNTKSRNNCKRISSIRRNMHSESTQRRKNFFFSASTRKSASSTCENHLALRKNDRNSFEIGRFISLFRVASIPDTGGHIFIAKPSRSKTYEYANLTVIPIIILFVKTRCNFASRNEKAIRSIFI